MHLCVVHLITLIVSYTEEVVQLLVTVHACTLRDQCSISRWPCMAAKNMQARLRYSRHIYNYARTCTLNLITINHVLLLHSYGAPENMHVRIILL